MDTLDLRAQYAELTGDVKNAYAMREDGPEGFLYSDNTIRRALEQHGSLYDDPYTASRNQQAANRFLPSKAHAPVFYHPWRSLAYQTQPRPRCASRGFLATPASCMGLEITVRLCGLACAPLASLLEAIAAARQALPWAYLIF